jgi:hypothetical protein
MNNLFSGKNHFLNKIHMSVKIYKCYSFVYLLSYAPRFQIYTFHNQQISLNFLRKSVTN